MQLSKTLPTNALCDGFTITQELDQEKLELKAKHKSLKKEHLQLLKVGAAYLLDQALVAKVVTKVIVTDDLRKNNKLRSTARAGAPKKF